jgi:hypothetical protein
MPVVEYAQEHNWLMLQSCYGEIAMLFQGLSTGRQRWADEV